MSNLWKRKVGSTEDDLVQIKSKFDSEFRRFSIAKPKTSDHNNKIDDSEEQGWSLEAFRKLIEKLHRLPEDSSFSIYYTDPIDGDLLPINNCANFRLALIRASPLLRIHVTPESIFGERVSWTPVRVKSNSFGSRFTFFGTDETAGSYSPAASVGRAIGRPKNFRHISTLIDADQLPPTQRRVRLRKNDADGRPLGFCVKEGWNVGKNAKGEITRTRTVLISRLVKGGLVESTGLLSINDEILEINGISIGDGSKTLDQVTDMLVANASDLVITIRSEIPIASVSKIMQIDKPEKSVSMPNTPENSLRKEKKVNLRMTRKEVSSSVFYLDDQDNDHEDVVISFVHDATKNQE